MRIATLQQTLNHTVLKNVFRHGVAALLLAALVSACATPVKPAATDIKQRAQARWDAVLKGDFGTAYGFYSPGYRSSHSRADFEIALRSRRIRWTSAEVKESSCKADVCKVKTHIGYSVAGALPGVPVWKGTKVMEENWVRTNGQWWFLPED